MESGQAPREIVILLFDGVQSLDVTGPLEVFSAAERLLAWNRRSAELVRRAPAAVDIVNPPTMPTDQDAPGFGQVKALDELSERALAGA